MHPMELTNIISAYRVAHRLPGRIRLHIPALEKLSEHWRIYLKPSAELIKMGKGINTVEIQPVSGSLLIGYDPELMDETGIQKWLRALVVDFLKMTTPSSPLNDADIRLRFAQLRDRLNAEGRARNLD